MVLLGVAVEATVCPGPSARSPPGAEPLRARCAPDPDERSCWPGPAGVSSSEIQPEGAHVNYCKAVQVNMKLVFCGELDKNYSESIIY